MKCSRFLAVVWIACTAFAAEPALEPGTVPIAWRSGGPNCLEVPDWQVQAYNPSFIILRQSGCVFYDKPFLYLIFGDDKVLLEDTGGGDAHTAAPFVMDLIARWATQNNRKSAPQLIVVHSHSHGGHTAGDKQFAGLANVQVITHSKAEIARAAGITKWPEEVGSIDLGNRIVDVIPFPGHTADSIALYDRKTGNLLTGDALFAGRLCATQAEIAEFTASAARLAAFAQTHRIAHVLGGHIEQSTTAYVDYAPGVIYQPAEHPLALSRAHIFELSDALSAMKGTLVTAALPDFSVVPESACVPAAERK